MKTLSIDFMISIKFSSTISTVGRKKCVGSSPNEHKIAEFLEKILNRKIYLKSFDNAWTTLTCNIYLITNEKQLIQYNIWMTSYIFMQWLVSGIISNHFWIILSSFDWVNRFRSCSCKFTNWNATKSFIKKYASWIIRIQAKVFRNLQ